MNTLVIGYGEIGKAIATLEMKAGNSVSILDPFKGYFRVPKKYDIVHISIPYSKDFIKTIKIYLRDYPSTLVFIHSTLPVGTTTKIGCPYLVHSPVRGNHANMVKGLKLFPKYVSGPKAKKAVKYLRSLSIPAKVQSNYETTELAKILDTSYYGWCIAFAKYAQELCDLYNVDYDEVYTEWNNSYNAGCLKYDLKDYVRPVLTPPPERIGGHCVYENAKLLPKSSIRREIERLR